MSTTPVPLTNQLVDLLDDLTDASVLWQAGAVLCSVLLGWLAAWLL